MFGSLRKYLRFPALPILMAMLGLISVGICGIYMASGGSGGLAQKQMIFAALGLGVFFVVSMIPYQRFGSMAYVLFGLTLVALVLVFIHTPLTMPRKGAHRWIGVQELSIQPSEVAKITYIILLAWYLRRGDNYRKLRGLILPFVLTFVPMGLILVEPDLGTSLLFLPTLYVMLYLAGAKVSHLLGIVALGTILVVVPVVTPAGYCLRRHGELKPGEINDRKMLAYWNFAGKDGKEYSVSALPIVLLEQHQISRIVGWKFQDLPSVARDKGYQAMWSKIILGSGQMTGQEDWTEPGSYYRWLPENHTDFIFSVVGGQWGFVGCITVLLLYLVIFVFGVEIATLTYDAFGRLLAVGVLALLFTQLALNLCVAMGVMPVTGMTLPFLSYGGSSLLVNCAAIGLLVNIGQNRPILLGQRPFEHGDKREKPPSPYSPLADGAWDRRGPTGR